MPKRKRSYNLRRIKATWPYRIEEIVKLLGVHPNTVTRWLGEGLEADTSTRPFLIRGDALIRFLSEKQQARKSTCALEEFYCFRCRRPQPAWLGIADIIIEDGKRMRVKAVCACCEGPVSKVQSVRKLPQFEVHLEIQKLEGRHLIGHADPSVYGDKEGGCETNKK